MTLKSWKSFVSFLMDGLTSVGGAFLAQLFVDMRFILL
jgi:hypothetical protein